MDGNNNNSDDDDDAAARGEAENDARRMGVPVWVMETRVEGFVNFNYLGARKSFIVARN